jgi:ABC-type multidrug transport system ATPase subunit
MVSPIHLRGVTGRLGRRRVGPYDLEVGRGEVVALVGVNGSGKTTSLHLALGLRRHDGGSVQIGGRPVDHRRPPQGVGASLLDDGHLPWLGARRQLALLASLRPGPPGPEAVLELVGLADAADAPTSTYSAGMLRRFGLARALLGAPPVLVLDEPTAALDEVAGEWLAGVLVELCSGGSSVLVATHDAALIDAVGPEVLEVAGCRTR